MFRLAALPLALVVFGTAATASAESSYSLTYRSAEGCPTRERFVTELDLRSQGLREATNETRDVSIEIWFEGDEPTTGILLLRDGEGRPTVRSIPGATCDEVVAGRKRTAYAKAVAARPRPPAGS